MNKKVKVLLLVAEPWRKDDSGGNTIDNFFSGMDNIEFAQVYCSELLPDNNCCSKYYQITDSEVIKKFITHQEVGRRLESEYLESKEYIDIARQPKSQQSVLSKILKRIKKLRPEILITIKKLLWYYSNWKTEGLEAFIKNFDADVIYAPCYASPFQLALTRYVKELTGLKIVTWSADDCYSLRHFSLDPFFWINRFWNRHCLRKTYPYYDEFYSISEEEVEELEPIVNKLREKRGRTEAEKTPVKIGILRKGVVVPETFIGRDVHKPIRFIYAGGLYLNRDKSLIEIANTLRKINRQEILVELHIYTGTQLSDKNAMLLNDGRSVYNHGLIKAEELSKIYQHCDVAIHCESFDLKYRLMTRLSFSTKIIDCFQSGCAILAIAWENHTGIKCLMREDAAICVTSVKEIERTVTRIIENPELIKEYALKAYECEKRNHRIEDVQKKLRDAFLRCSK